MATVSSGLSEDRSNLNEFRNSGSLSGAFIEPDVSIRKTRFARADWVFGNSNPLIPIRINFVCAFHGVGMIETFALNGSARFCGRTEPHHHARCLACGGVSDVAGELGDREIAALRSQAKEFHLVGYELELTGYCSDCAPPMGNRAGASSN